MKLKHDEIRAIFLAILTFELGIKSKKALVNNGRNKIVESNERLNIEKLSFKEKSFLHAKDKKPSVDFLKILSKDKRIISCKIYQRFYHIYKK